MGWPKGKPRPKKEEREEPVAVDPAAALAEGEEPEETRAAKPRGRPKKAGKPLNVNGLEALLFSVHMTASVVLKAPEIALDDDEAKQLARAGAQVARHYDIPEVPEKMLDWGNLFVCLFVVYKPKVAAIAARKKAKDEADKNAAEVSEAQIN